ncbi:MAG: bifunctional aspartate kinase/homoserine dehydrogenase I [Balneolales bacterium]
MNNKPLYIVKFGGTSLLDSGRINQAVAIVSDRLKKAKVVVVVSALGGVTDTLIDIINMAKNSDNDWENQFEQLKARHLQISQNLINNTSGENLIHNLFNDLKKHLLKVYNDKAVTPEKHDLILSYGERASCNIFAAALRNAGLESQAHESQNFVRTNQNFGEAEVNLSVTSTLINEAFSKVNGITPVVTGFIGSTENLQITTLGRSGSDYTAGLLGEALKAERVEIWTDVNGVLTADPDIAPSAITIPHLHYSEIAEMAHFGTKVLHPKTVLPLGLLNIPIHIKNSFFPKNSGTLISHETIDTHGRLRSVSVKKDIVLIGIKSKGLDRIIKLSPRVLQALAEADINVLFNASASSDYGISVVINANQKEKAEEVLTRALDKEILLGLLDKPAFHQDVNMVTVIGESLKNDLGLSGAVLSVLGENNIAPLSAARGVATRHLSLIIPESLANMAARLINDHFCIHARQLRVFVAGTGTIGGEFIRLAKNLKDQDIDLSIIGACNSMYTTWNNAGLGKDVIKILEEQGKPTDWEKIIDHLIREFPYRTVFVDATGSGEVARYYTRLLEAGIHIATPSKRSLTFEQSYFDQLSHYINSNPTHFFFEPAVGAGLPVLQTLRDLLASGDEITKISGVVSGTMTYLFGQLENGESFGKAVHSAKEFGYSEPDPRDDLSGEDVVRKFMILARASGFKVERHEVEVENLTPPDLADLSLDDFLKRISDYDEDWKLKVKEASQKGKVLRYVGEMNEGKIKIETQAVPVNSPLGSLRGADNQIIIQTKRYRDSPIIIQGPGAGKEVTAGALLSDVQKIGRLVF